MYPLLPCAGEDLARSRVVGSLQDALRERGDSVIYEYRDLMTYFIGHLMYGRSSCSPGDCLRVS